MENKRDGIGCPKYVNRVVYTNYVADLLIDWGETFSHIRPDLKYPERNVFVFKNSESFESNLQRAIKIQVKSKGLKVY